MVTAPKIDLEAGFDLRLLADAHPGVWAELILGYQNEPFHWEWYECEICYPRLCIVAPRESAKSEVFSVVTTAHKARRTGFWQYLFSDTLDQAKDLLSRTMTILAETDPHLLDPLYRDAEDEKILANFSRITVAGRGKKIRGQHPDRIVGDDILDDKSTDTHLQRKKVHRWWFGTVAEMAHGPIVRRLGWGKIRPPEVRMIQVPPTNIVLAGTPFHEEDLLLGTRSNRLYHFRRYQAVYEPGDLIPGTMAVEIHPMPVAA